MHVNIAAAAAAAFSQPTGLSHEHRVLYGIGTFLYCGFTLQLVNYGINEYTLSLLAIM